MSPKHLTTNLDTSWQELITLSKEQARYNFGAPQLLESELEIIAMRIEAAKASRDPSELQLCIDETEGLVKRLKSLLEQSQHIA